jgi:putative transposase
VYNKALAERMAAWNERRESLSFAAQSRALTLWKKEEALSFLREVSSVPLQQTLRSLNAAYRNFFEKRASYPVFKKKRQGGSAQFTRSAFRFQGGELWLAKMEAPLDIRWSQPLPEGVQPSSVTVSLEPAGRWHISLLCDDPTIQPLPPAPNEAVGVDLGLNALVTLSTGEKVDNPRHDDRELAKKRRLSRRLARKQKGSKNREKARGRLARLHARVADQRRDYLHKLSTRLVRENQAVVVEDLHVKGMVRNRRLARSISGAGWGELVRQLSYKCAWYGRTLIKVARFFPSSKTCSTCGLVVKELPLSERSWVCSQCSAGHDRDHNAAKNLLAAGLAVSACGPGVRQGALRSPLRSGLKQEDPGATQGLPAP